MGTFVACLGITLLILLNPSASAGPIRDRMIAERIANAQSDEYESRASGKASIPAGITVQHDVAYGTDAAQRMDVYIPQNAHNAPVVFMVHGGAWFVGDKASAGVVDNKAARWLPKGIVFISVNYRMLPKADPLAQANDVAMAMAKAQGLAVSWGGDPARFILMGHSAGAHLVALIASSPGIAKKHGVQPWLGMVMLDSAALDVVRIMESKHMRLYDRAFGSDPSGWKAASPFHQLSGMTAPVLAVCSTQREDSCPQARSFIAKTSSLGARSSVLPVDLSHKKINHELGLPSAYTDSVESFMRSLGLPL